MMEQLTAFFSNPLRLTLIAASVVILCAIIVVSLKPRKTHGTPKKDYSNFHTINNIDLEEVDVQNNLFDVETPDRNSTDQNSGNLADQREERIEYYDEQALDQKTGTEEPVDAQQHAQTLVENKVPEDFIVLHVTTPKGFSIPGDALAHILGELGMVFGPHDIFHYFDPENNAMPLFSVVNLVEPGYFDLSKPVEFTTTGVSFFMRLPLPLPEYDSSNAYSVMLHLAQKFARHMQGKVLDQDKEELSSHKIKQLRKLAEQYAKAPSHAKEELSV